MHETPWLPAVAVLCSGLVVGTVLALVFAIRAKRRRSKRSADAGRADAEPVPSSAQSVISSEIDDLRSRKAQLFEQLRDLQDTGSAVGEERAELERQAAVVLRDLAAAEKAAAEDEARGLADSVGRAELRGAVKGVAAVAVVALVGVALWQAVRPRAEGMGITGNDPSARGAGTAQAEEHPTEGQAGPIQPKDTERLRQARAAVKADPSSLDALVELGYALAEAGGWIDLYKNAQTILARDPSNADALIQSAMLHYVMRQPKQAEALIDRVLQAEPENVRALEVGGRIALGTENWSRAVELLSHATAKLGPGPGAALEPLLQQARREAARAPAASRTPRPAAPSPSPPRAASGAIVGVVKVQEGVSLPSAGVLFVIARPAGVAGGPPAAVARLPASGFPRAFRLDQSNAMMGGQLPAKVSLSARLDADGNAVTHQPEDLVGVAPGPVSLGTGPVEIILKPAGG